MKRKSKAISACFTLMCVCAVLTSCGNSGEISAEIPESSSKAEISAEQSSEVEDTTVEETTEAPTSAETTTVATIPIEDRKPKVSQFTGSYTDEGATFEYHYRFVPEEATVISDDINLGLITIDGKEFDITALSNAYGEEEIQNIFGEQAGLYTTDRLIADGVFDDVYISKKGSPVNDTFVFGNDFDFKTTDVEVEIIQEVLGFSKSKGAYDFINVEYVNGWFKGLYSKCFATNTKTSHVVEQINGEAFVEIKMGDPKPQYTANEDNLITYTDKNIAVGSSTTYSDLVSMFGAEPTYINDTDYALGNIYTYRNSTVTVGFVINNWQADKDWTEESRNNAPVVAVYMWLND